MGLDLKLIPEMYHYSQCVHTELPLQLRNYEVFDALKSLADPLNKEIWKLSDEGDELRANDAYDEPLTFVPARKVFTVLRTVEEEVSAWDRACIAFIGQLEDDTRVILWWC